MQATWSTIGWISEESPPCSRWRHDKFHLNLNALENEDYSHICFWWALSLMHANRLPWSRWDFVDSRQGVSTRSRVLRTAFGSPHGADFQVFNYSSCGVYLLPIPDPLFSFSSSLFRLGREPISSVSCVTCVSIRKWEEAGVSKGKTTKRQSDWINPLHWPCLLFSSTAFVLLAPPAGVFINRQLIGVLS